MNQIAKSLSLGVVSGLRSATGVAAVAWAAPTSGSPQPLSTLSSPWGRRASAVAAAGELVVDKLPMTPSRLAPPGLVARVVAGALAALLLAQRDRADVRVAAGLGALGAVAGSFGGARWRALAAKQFGTDWPGAVVEDATTLTLVAVTVRDGCRVPPDVAHTCDPT